MFRITLFFFSTTLLKHYLSSIFKDSKYYEIVINRKNNHNNGRECMKAIVCTKYRSPDFTKNLEMVKSLGAEFVMDYTKGDFADSGEIYDVIFDADSKMSQSSKRAFKEDGVFLDVD